MEELDYEQAGQTPGNRKPETNIAVEVEGLVRVIPPALVKYFFQHKASGPFQSGGQDNGTQEQQQEVALQRLQKGQHDDHSKAVDRAPGAVEKSPVDKAARDQGGIADLGTPAQKGVDEKEK